MHFIKTQFFFIFGEYVELVLYEMNCIILMGVLQVLDEADRLLNEDFEKSLDEILNAIPRERRTYLFSATMTKKVWINFSNITHIFSINFLTCSFRSFYIVI